jgi:hypothetical protein
MNILIQHLEYLNLFLLKQNTLLMKLCKELKNTLLYKIADKHVHEFLAQELR